MDLLTAIRSASTSADHKRFSADAARLALSRVASSAEAGMGCLQLRHAPDRNREFKYYRFTDRAENNLWLKNRNGSRWRKPLHA